MPESRSGLVLVAEDDPAIADLIGRYLRRDGFTVHTETDGAAALAAIRRIRPVAVVLDVGLPTMDGITVCRELRATDDWTPILFVTARDDEVDRVLGLELGADDYVTKPFSPRELAARVKTVLRRGTTTTTVVEVGRTRIDITQRRTWADDREVPLTPTEFDLLAQLMRHPKQVFDRQQLLSAVWSYSPTGTRTVDVHVAQLRAKLGDANPIRTIRGIGYAADTQ